MYVHARARARALSLSLFHSLFLSLPIFLQTPMPPSPLKHAHTQVDVEFAEEAAEMGATFKRAPSFNDDPAFGAALGQV